MKTGYGETGMVLAILAFAFVFPHVVTAQEVALGAADPQQTKASEAGVKTAANKADAETKKVPEPAAKDDSLRVKKERIALNAARMAKRQDDQLKRNSSGMDRVMDNARKRSKAKIAQAKKSKANAGAVP